MAKELTISEIEDAPLWDAFVDESPQGTVFATSAWLGATAAACGGEPVMLGVWRNGRLAAGTAFLLQRRGPLRKASMPAVVPYGGVLYRPETGKRWSEAESFDAECAEQIVAYLGRRFHYAQVVNPPGFNDVRPFVWNGWRADVRYTYLIDIEAPDRVWDVMEHRVRKVIGHAEDTLEVGEAIDYDRFSSLFSRIYHDRGVKAPVESATIGRFAAAVLERVPSEMRTVRDRTGEIVSAVILVHDRRRVYTWMSGSLPDRNADGAYSLLFWDTIRRYAGTHRQLDLVGANMPSIAFFKKGFGGVLTPYYACDRYSSRWPRLAFHAYRTVKRLLP